MNSNALNVAAGLLVPAVIVGLGAASGPATLVAIWYFGLTAFALGCAYAGRGLRRWHGALIIVAYLAFAGTVLSSAYGSRVGMLLSATLPVAAAIALTARMIRNSSRQDTVRAGTSAGQAASARELGNAIAGIALLAQRDGHRTTAMSNEAAPPQRRSSGDSSLVAGWPVRTVWGVALAGSSVIAAADAILGHHVILIWLLIAGPCCGLLTGRRAQTAVAGAWAVALAVFLGIPDGIWGTWTHLAFLGPVVIVAVVSSASAAAIQIRGSVGTLDAEKTRRCRVNGQAFVGVRVGDIHVVGSLADRGSVGDLRRQLERRVVLVGDRIENPVGE
jgi:hypothetical protein